MSLPPPAGLSAWLAAREAGVAHLRPEAARQVIWAGAAGQKTKLALVYLHGFSAAAPEVRPLPDLVAAGLGANLHFARLTGHGADSAAMAAGRAGLWRADVAEALAIGRLIGERVVVMASSMGGALAVLAAAEPGTARDLAGLVLIAPAFRLRARGSGLLGLPGARSWLPWLIGAERATPPRSAGHDAAWTLRYGVPVLAELGQVVARAARLDPARIKVPALVLLSEDDRVVDSAATVARARRWGAPCRLVEVAPGPGDDPSAHVLAGDILSPGLTAPLAAQATDWILGLDPQG